MAVVPAARVLVVLYLVAAVQSELSWFDHVDSNELDEWINDKVSREVDEALEELSNEIPTDFDEEIEGMLNEFAEQLDDDVNETESMTSLHGSDESLDANADDRTLFEDDDDAETDTSIIEQDVTDGLSESLDEGDSIQEETGSDEDGAYHSNVHERYPKKHGKGRFQYKMHKAQRKTHKLMKKIAKLHKRDHRITNSTLKCMDINDKIEVICSQLEITNQHHSVMEKVHRRWQSAKGKSGKWSKCCAEAIEDRKSCLVEEREKHFTKMCAKKQKQDKRGGQKRLAEKWLSCCPIKGQKMVDCFDEVKQQTCASVQTKITPTKQRHTGRKAKITGLEITVENISWNYSNHNSSDGSSDEPRRHHFSLWKDCCSSGKNVSSKNDSCADDYFTWRENRTWVYRTPLCAKAFISCCMHQKPKSPEVKAALKENELLKKSKPQNYVDDSRGDDAEKIPYDRRLKVCCFKGKSVASEDVNSCETSFERWRKHGSMRHMPEQCADTFVSCCSGNKQKTQRTEQVSGRNKESARASKHYKLAKSGSGSDSNQERQPYDGRLSICCFKGKNFASGDVSSCERSFVKWHKHSGMRQMPEECGNAFVSCCKKSESKNLVHVTLEPVVDVTVKVPELAAPEVPNEEGQMKGRYMTEKKLEVTFLDEKMNPQKKVEKAEKGRPEKQSKWKNTQSEDKNVKNRKWAV